MSKPKKIWDNCKFIGEVLKSPSTKLRVELVARDGVKYVNIREWYMKKSEQVWKPGLAGFAVPIKLPMAGERQDAAKALIETIEQAIEQASTFAIEDDENAVWSNK